MEIEIEALEAAGGDRLAVEIVERKGLGHPDSLCDALAEEASRALCRAYRDLCGRILHHNVDKALLWGGQARPAYGGGEVVKPIEFFLAGRASAACEGREIDIDAVVREAAMRWLERNLPTVDAPRDVRWHSLVRPGAPDLVELYDRQRRTGIWLANDTSCGAGYAPLSRLERVVLAVERRLSGAAIQARFPAIGPDIKVMGVRRGERTVLTVACAFIGRYLAGIDDYLAAKAQVAAIARDVARSEGAGAVEVEVNSADDPAAGSVYLTVTGTSAEAGDDGEAGRGNRVNGLIAPFRPATMESVAGKNPVTHVGKIYNIAAGLIAQGVVDGIAEVDEAHCLLVSQIGKPVGEPQVAELRLRLGRGMRPERIRDKAQDIVRRELELLAALPDDLLAGRTIIDSWPLRPPASPAAELWREVVADAEMTAAETGRAGFAPRVMAALAEVPREAFVLPGEEVYAYVNTALPIGHGQTISQPYIVALMTDMLDPSPDHVVLEVGTGSGYQAAVLARLVRRVCSFERVEPLAREAAARLARLGYRNVEVRAGDGSRGWPEEAPFDGIIVTAGTPEIPPALLAQLKPGGRMVIPIGEPYRGQILTLVWKDAAGGTHRQALLPVAFVPMVQGG
jgi:S-adenosylmethionine synthetase